MQGTGRVWYGILISEFAPAGLSAILWRLEEAEVVPQDLGFGVAGEVGEAWGGMTMGHDEQDGHVDWAEGDLGFGLVG